MGEGHGERDKSAAMPENSNDDDDDDMALEMDPSHRFSRYHQKVGSGRFKRVYRGFDEKNGIDVAWSKIERHVNNMELDDETMERITAEMRQRAAAGASQHNQVLQVRWPTSAAGNGPFHIISIAAKIGHCWSAESSWRCDFSGQPSWGPSFQIGTALELQHYLSQSRKVP